MPLLGMPAKPILTTAAQSRVERGWAQLNIDGIGLLTGEVVGFNRRIAVVALDHAVAVGPGRYVSVAMGVEGRETEGVSGETIMMISHHDGRRCLAVELSDTTPATARRNTRMPFTGRVDVMVVSSRSSSDHGYRVQAFDLSRRGLGAVSEREIPVRGAVLLRFPVPPNRDTVVQVRAAVAYCRSAGSRRFQVGFEFERVGATQLPPTARGSRCPQPRSTHDRDLRMQAPGGLAGGLARGLARGSGPRIGTETRARDSTYMAPEPPH